MLTIELKTQITTAINSNRDLLEIRSILIKFKDSGGTQKDAVETLESIRQDASEEFEDKILEILDIAVGWCSSRNKVW